MISSGHFGKLKPCEGLTAERPVSKILEVCMGLVHLDNAFCFFIFLFFLFGTLFKL